MYLSGAPLPLPGARPRVGRDFVADAPLTTEHPSPPSFASNVTPLQPHLPFVVAPESWSTKVATAVPAHATATAAATHYPTGASRSHPASHPSSLNADASQGTHALCALMQTTGSHKYDVHVPPVIRSSNISSTREYRPISFLGRGSSCVCVQVQDWREGQYVRDLACKIVPKDYYRGDQNRLQKLMNELKLHRKLRHPFVVKFEHALEDDNNLYVFTELCPGHTLKHMQDESPNQQFTPLQIWIFMRQLLEALRYMHRHRMLHRDIKVANIFLSADRRSLKLGDLGYVCHLANDSERLIDICGTPNYSSPSLVQLSNTKEHWKQQTVRDKQARLQAVPNGDQTVRVRSSAANCSEEMAQHAYGADVDIWSTGVTLCTMLEGTPPFHSKSKKTTYAAILAARYLHPPTTKCSATVAIIDYILHPDARQRPTAAELLRHPYFLFPPASTRYCTQLIVASEGAHALPRWQCSRDAATQYPEFRRRGT